MLSACFALLTIHAPTGHALPVGQAVRGGAPFTRRSVVVGAGAAAASLALMGSPLAASAKDRITGYPQQRNWATTLSTGQYYILRQGGTEPPNSSPLAKEKRDGTFVCAGCRTPLFASDQKFESGTGWPSYAKGLEGVETVSSIAALLLGSELRCSGCGGHLGDVFNDGGLCAVPLAKK
jgi:peptide-methionine (R)-S-oxide reductase